MMGENAALPLAGLRVLAVEQYGAGPFGTMHLADLGADVIKIENPVDGGDICRHLGPHFLDPDGSGEGLPDKGDSHFFQTFNRNKRSLTLDLQQEGARAVLDALVADADCLFNNLRGDLPQKLGLTYDAVKHANPGIVCAHLSAYGRDSERASWPGYDFLMQAETGWLAMSGEPDGLPARCGLSVVDYMTGVTAAMAMLAGVIGARASGIGRDIDVSLFDVALGNLAYVGTWYLNEADAATRLPRSSHPTLTPSQLYRTRDGWIFLMCNKEKFWPILCDLVGRADWISDPDFVDFSARLANRGRLTDMLDGVLGQRDTAEWMALFAGKIPASPVNDVAGALDNPFVRERGRVSEIPYPGRGPVKVVASPVRLSDAEIPVRTGPALGADAEDILRAAGLDAKAIAMLRDQGVI